MKRSLSLLELSFAVLIVFVLATISIPMYKNTVENAKAKVCETNLKMLQAAVEVYGLENNVLPGSLTQLQDRHIRRAWAQIFRGENKFLLKCAYFLVDFDARGLAYAQEASDRYFDNGNSSGGTGSSSLLQMASGSSGSTGSESGSTSSSVPTKGPANFFSKYLSGSIQYITCPADTTPPPSGHSYGLNAELANMSLSEYKKLKNSDASFAIVGDSDDPLFDTESALTDRHVKVGFFGKTEKYSQVMLSGKAARKPVRFHGGGFMGWGGSDRGTDRDRNNHDKWNYYSTQQIRTERNSGNCRWCDHDR